MDDVKKLTRDDAIFFMEMVGSVKSPNYEPKSFKKKPYTKLLNERNSINYKRFIKIYKTLRHILSKRELMILDEAYGLNNDRKLLKIVAESLKISPERVRQIRNMAEYKIVNKLLVAFLKI